MGAFIATGETNLKSVYMCVCVCAFLFICVHQHVLVSAELLCFPQNTPKNRIANHPTNPPIKCHPDEPWLSFGGTRRNNADSAARFCQASTVQPSTRCLTISPSTVKQRSHDRLVKKCFRALSQKLVFRACEKGTRKTPHTAWGHQKTKRWHHVLNQNSDRKGS